MSGAPQKAMAWSQNEPVIVLWPMFWIVKVIVIGSPSQTVVGSEGET
jgi:hypothetical protein